MTRKNKSGENMRRLAAAIITVLALSLTACGEVASNPIEQSRLVYDSNTEPPVTNDFNVPQEEPELRTINNELEEPEPTAQSTVPHPFRIDTKLSSAQNPPACRQTGRDY